MLTCREQIIRLILNLTSRISFSVRWTQLWRTDASFSLIFAFSSRFGSFAFFSSLFPVLFFLPPIIFFILCSSFNNVFPLFLYLFSYQSSLCSIVGLSTRQRELLDSFCNPLCLSRLNFQVTKLKSLLFTPFTVRDNLFRRTTLSRVQEGNTICTYTLQYLIFNQ